MPQSGQREVFLVDHKKYGTVILKRGQTQSIVTLERIRREVDLLKGIDSSFFPSQLEFLVDANTMKFEIIEEFIDGGSLSVRKGKFQNPKEIFSLIRSIASGLSEVWDLNIVHRDLKPDNIIIRPNGKPCVIDFGIARFNDKESLTKTFQLIGPCTPIYAAPEQLTNNKNLIDCRTDFFALGIITLELFLGIHPFDPYYVGNQMSIMENIRDNIYVVQTSKIHANCQITEFASLVLQTQPYLRLRTSSILINALTKYL